MLVGAFEVQHVDICTGRNYLGSPARKETILYRRPQEKLHGALRD